MVMIPLITMNLITHLYFIYSHYFLIICYNSQNNYMPKYTIFQRWNINSTSFGIAISCSCMFCLHACLLSYPSISTDPLLSRYAINGLIDCNIHNMHIQVYTFYLWKNIHSTFWDSLSSYMYIHLLSIFSFSQSTMFPSKTPPKSTTPKNPPHWFITDVKDSFQSKKATVLTYKKWYFY